MRGGGSLFEGRLIRGELPYFSQIVACHDHVLEYIIGA